MIDAFLILTPVLLFAVVALLGFVGCGSFGAAPSPPSIFLTASPDTIDPADPKTKTSTLTWIVTSLQTASIDQGIGQVYNSSDPAAKTTGTVPVSPTKTTTYTMSGLDSGGKPVSTASAIVTVKSSAPPPPVALQVTHLQTVTSGPSAGKSRTASLPAFPGSGKLIVVTVEWGGVGTTVALTGAPFTQIASDNLNPQQAATFYATNVSGAITVTATLSATSTTDFNLIVSAYDNVAPASAPDRQSPANGSGTAAALAFATAGLTAGDLVYAVTVARNSALVLAGSLSPGVAPAFIPEAGQGSYLMLEDYVIKTADLASPQINVSATNTTGTATSRWYIFAMRIKHA